MGTVVSGKLFFDPLCFDGAWPTFTADEDRTPGHARSSGIISALIQRFYAILIGSAPPNSNQGTPLR